MDKKWLTLHTMVWYASNYLVFPGNSPMSLSLEKIFHSLQIWKSKYWFYLLYLCIVIILAQLSNNSKSFMWQPSLIYQLTDCWYSNLIFFNYKSQKPFPFEWRGIWPPQDMKTPDDDKLPSLNVPLISFPRLSLDKQLPSHQGLFIIRYSYCIFHHLGPVS